MNRINIQGQPDYPFDSEGLDFLQNMILSVSKLAGLGGSNYILSGCVQADNKVSAGMVVVQGELLPFLGGDKLSHITIKETKVSIDALGKNYPEAEISRIAEFSNAGYLWEDFKQVLSNGELQDKIEQIRGDAPGTVKMWAGEITKIPEDYLLCDGRLLKKDNYPVLFENIGFRFGVEGTDGFRIPDLQGQFVVGYNKNKDNYNEIGKKGGQDTVTLSEDEIPSHDHTNSPQFNKLSARASDVDMRATPGGIDETGADKEYNVASMTPQMWELATMQKVGGGKAHENRPPFFVLAYIIKVF